MDRDTGYGVLRDQMVFTIAHPMDDSGLGATEYFAP